MRVRNQSVWRRPAVATAAALAFAAHARAEEFPPAEAAARAAPNPSGEVMVTARRRLEEARAVPMAIDVLDGRVVRDQRISELQDLQRYTPSLQTSQINRDDAFVTMRGQGPGVGAFPGVLTYFNDVPFHGLGQGAYYDLSGIQVLKGPQGTLFGRNSNGGAVLFSSTRPGADFGGYLQGTVGDYADRELEGAVNLPLVKDTLLLRLAGSAAHRDGFTRLLGSDERLDDRGFQAGRISLSWLPNTAVRNDLVGDWTRIRTNGTSAILVGLNPAGPLAQFPPQSGIEQIAFGLLAQQQALGPRVQVGASTDPRRKVNSWGLMDRLDVELGGGAVFTNIAAVRRYQRLFRSDYDGTPLPLVDYSVTPDGWVTDETQYSEEAQVHGQAGRLSYTGGAFLQDNRASGDQRQLGVLYFQPIEQIDQAHDLSRALYGEVSYDAGALLPGLSLTGGYRHTWDRRRQRAATANLATGTCSGTGAVPPACLLEDVARFDAGNWNLAAQWRVSPAVTLYATARRGYKSGGLNLGQPFADRRVYGPEFLTDQEVGLKSAFSAGPAAVRFNLDAYRGKYSDIQVNALVIDSTAIYNIVENGARATIKGVEADLTATFAGVFDLSLAYAYTDAAYDHYISSIYGDLSGAPWPYTSRHKGSVGAAWRLPELRGVGRPQLSVHYSFQSRSTFGYDPDPATREPGYGLVDARLDLRQLAGKPVDLGLFVTNLGDKLYRTGVIGIYNSAGIDSAVYGEPRMFGAQLRVHFGGEGS